MGLLQKRYGLITLIAVAAFVAFDIDKHGSFKRSRTGSFLKDIGAVRLADSVFSKFRWKCQQAYWWSKQHVPVYLNHVRQGLFPMLLVVRDMIYQAVLLLWNNARVIFQSAEKWFDSYSPGLWDSVNCWLRQGWSLLIDYATQLYTLILHYIAWWWTTGKELFTYIQTTHVHLML